MIVIHRMVDREAKKSGRKSIGSSSKDSAARILAAVVEVFGVVVQRRGHLSLVIGVNFIFIVSFKQANSRTT